jgi:hypothetical protein
VAAAASVGVHLLLLAALLPVVADAPEPELDPPLVITLTQPLPPVAPPAPTLGQDPGAGSPARKADKPTPPRAPEPAAPLPAPKPVPAPVRHRPARTPPANVPTVIAAAAPVSTVGQISVVGEAQLAGALTAGSGDLLQGLGPGHADRVLHHGWPLSSDDWDGQMMFFLSKGFRVIAHDRRGHGRSSQAPKATTWTPMPTTPRPSRSTWTWDAIHVGHSTGGGEVVRYVARTASPARRRPC